MRLILNIAQYMKLQTTVIDNDCRVIILIFYMNYTQQHYTELYIIMYNNGPFMIFKDFSHYSKHVIKWHIIFTVCSRKSLKI